MSKTTAIKINQLNNMNRAAQDSNLGSMLYSSANSNYPGGDYPNQVYFVNNISGASTNNGLTWETAMDQVSTAITAWEAYRTSTANLAANNAYVRGIIYVQGTATAYTNLTALPNYCDIIGVGADPRGNGAGIASITGGGTADAAAGSSRGLGLYNLQFTGSGAYYSFNAAVLFRSVIVNCSFVNCSNGARVVSGGGNTIRNCQFGGDTTTPTTAFATGTSNGNWNQCLVENNVFYGSTTGVSNAAYLSDGTVFRGNTVYGGTTGISDTSTNTGLASMVFYTGNWVSGGTNAIVITNSHANRSIGNSIVNNATGARDAASS